MTDPVRPVAPREDELPLIAKWRAEASYTINRGFAIALIKCARELESRAAAPVPCAASPADTVAEITAILDDFAPLRHGETKTLPQRLRDEIHDFQMVMDHCSEVYMYFSGGAISKPNTLPREVITLAGDLETDRTNEAIAEAREEWEAARATGEGARDEVKREVPDVSDAVDHRHRAVRGDDPVLPEMPEGREVATDRLAAPVAVSLDPHRLRIVRQIEVRLRDMLFNHESQLRAAHELAKSLLPADNSDLPKTEDLTGIWSDDDPHRLLDLEPYQRRLEELRVEGEKHLAHCRASDDGHEDGPDWNCPACDDIFGLSSALKDLLGEIARLRGAAIVRVEE